MALSSLRAFFMPRFLIYKFMKNLFNFKLFETLAYKELPGRVPAGAFFSLLGFNPQQTLRILEYWEENRGRFDVHYFPFRGNEPILGVFFENATVAINEKARAPKEIKLFIAFHESRHADQYTEGRFEEPYFQTVVNGNKEGFLAAYEELEREANDYAFSCMRDLGFGPFINPQERMLRGNERSGEPVYEMMRRDIEKYNPQTFSELLMDQIN